MGNIKAFIGETIIYGFANVFSRVFAMLLIPFYASHLGKIDYSNLVMLQSLFAILTFLLALNTGVFFYYYQYNNLKYRKIIFTSWFYYGLVISLLFIALLFFSAGWLSKIFIVTASNGAELKNCILLIGLQLIPYMFNNTNINFFRIDRKPRSVIVIVFLEALFTLITVYVILYHLKMGLAGVLLGQILARVLVAALFFKTAAFYVRIRNFSKILLKKMVWYSWPYFVISFFGWMITSMDKFMGTQKLYDKTDVALLALSMQLVIPIVVLADMVRMAVGPFVMSMHKESDADKTYQQVFDLSMYAAAVVVVMVVAATPLLTILLTNESFLPVIYVVPLMGLASIFSLAANQFSISFNLVNKNTYILYASVIAGGLSLLINFVFMEKLGFIVSGFSQIFSYLIMCAFLFFFGKKVTRQNLKLINVFWILLVTVPYIGLVYLDSDRILKGNYVVLISTGILTIAVMTIVYLRTQKLNLKMLFSRVFKAR